MYQVTKTDGTVLGAVEEPLYIRVTDSGSFAPTNAEHAIGVAYESVAYNLFPNETIEGAEVVLLSTFDGGKRIAELLDTIASLEDAMCDQDAAVEERISTIEDAICELDSANSETEEAS